MSIDIYEGDFPLKFSSITSFSEIVSTSTISPFFILSSTFPGLESISFNLKSSNVESSPASETKKSNF